MSEVVAGAKYVVGFMFDQSRSNVLLLHKLRPKWQSGRINGIGGRIESGESALTAMRREFAEEAGISHGNWKEFCVLSDFREWSIHFFWCVGSIGEAEQLTDEEPHIYAVDNLPETVIPNLRWLIPMALSMSLETIDHFEIQEIKNGSY